LSLVGFGGMVVVGLEQEEANSIVAEAVERGINYFDVAPTYGDGEAEEKLGIALQPYRDDVFLACKTICRDSKGAREELERSLSRLKTDRFDLYQFHGVTVLDEVDTILALGGAMETYAQARDDGQFEYLGFSAHSEAAAISLLDRVELDSALFPINATCFAQGDFGPRIIERAKERGVARLALKAMASRAREKDTENPYPNCWYTPVHEPERARLSLRFTLSEEITAAVPPGDIRLFRLAMDIASEFEPLSVIERQEFLVSTEGMTPIFQT
ncbi:MAG: aldo/keto reductase, partial [Candidatus Latescibacteria bacterium]|nr:aldo/keto reductase [Candidatus Latescibacterota bacterium]